MKNQCTGVILAGGLSSRMGSDKAKLRRGDSSMLAFCKTLLEDLQVSDIRISRNVGEGIKDVFEQCGPLGGIHAVLKAIQSTEAKSRAVIIIPVDMPLLQSNDLIQLIEHGQQINRPVCFADCYLPLYLPVNYAVINYLEDQLSNDGNRKIRGLIEHFDGVQLAHQNQSLLVNTNTPQQWQQFIAQQLTQ
ncbi:MAG: molybdenum cofactor guanylyltransferase [Algicola sp.]|nr:molybdenum cofactor guanylyltransferase [Algicola sp.]